MFPCPARLLRFLRSFSSHLAGRTITASYHGGTDHFSKLWCKTFVRSRVPRFTGDSRHFGTLSYHQRSTAPAGPIAGRAFPFGAPARKIKNSGRNPTAWKKSLKTYLRGATALQAMPWRA